VTAIRTKPDAVSVVGVKYESALASCTIPDKGILGSKAVTADMNTDVALRDNASRLTVTCSRTPVIMPDGTKKYPDIDFQLVTSSTLRIAHDPHRS
jgi:hypothetical protein